MSKESTELSQALELMVPSLAMTPPLNLMLMTPPLNLMLTMTPMLTINYSLLSIHHSVRAICYQVSMYS